MPDELFERSWSPESWRSRTAAQQPEWPDEQALDAALDRGMAALPEIAATRRDLGWTAAQIESYLRNFAFRLGPDEEKGAAEFVRLRAQLGSLRC